jgi:hypothetical protein
MTVRKWDRKNAGLWFIGVLGTIFAAIAIWYAKYTDWWVQWITPNQTPVQTINTGANVLVSTMSTQPPTQPGQVSPDSKPTNPPVTEGGSSSDTDAQRRPQLW